MGSDKSSNCVQKCPTNWFSLTNGALQALSWSCQAPLTSEACCSRWQSLFAHKIIHLNWRIMEEASGLRLWVSCHALKKQWNADYKSKQHVSHPTSTYRHEQWHKLSSQQKKPMPCPCHQPKISSGSCLWDVQHALQVRKFKPFGADHKAAAPTWVWREETWARRFQQQEHPRAAELLSSEASSPVSVFPTRAEARAKAGSSCEQSESFHRESFTPAK